ncbi:MAG: 5-(carboxyamino)imidazole ribonucleotide mutase [Candidatus Micrarchaeota archaeon]
MERVLIIIGSESDRKISEKAEEILNEFQVKFRTEVASAHRNPEKLEKILKKTNANVIIAIAGLSAHLPGVCASKTIKPVIGVPVNVKLEGLDALLSIMNMPSGIPVASVGVDSGKNAALLALQIFAVSDKKLQKKLSEYRKKIVI